MVNNCLRSAGLPSFRLILPLLFALLGAMAQPGQAAVNMPTPCQSGFVQYGPGGLPLRSVAWPQPVNAPASQVRLEWLGHSSFQLLSPAGLRLLMDPNGLHPAPAVPDVITVSNLHETHRAVGPQLETAQILWGIHPVHGWQRFVRTIRDVTLFNVPSYGSRGELETSRVHNSIFVFRLGGLCVVHLGNLRHVLTRPQLEQIGTPDVVLVPVDGLFNLDYADIIKVITQLQPRLVVPMHIEVAQQAEAFVQHTAERYPVRRLAGRTLMLSQPQLPAETEIVRFGH